MLAHSQRARLMRSVRKVEALLGETPLFATTNDPSSIPTSHYTASSANPSVRGPGAARESNRPVLFVRMPTGTSIASGAHPSPLSPTSGISLNSSSPATPSAAVMAAEEETGRRRKVAKLSRTFGENVAPELVFSAASDAARIRRLRGASTLSGGLTQGNKSSGFSAVTRGLSHGTAINAAQDAEVSESTFGTGAPDLSSVRPSGEAHASESADSNSDVSLIPHDEVTVLLDEGAVR
ncbi:hypothetical protein C8R44DRAFT_742735 [Mycena epipterygia]|nr:hypothetical protein C8R44DRAFT_742735 [Mycena epipterygia]